MKTKKTLLGFFLWVLLTSVLRALVKESKMENFDNFYVEKIAF